MELTSPQPAQREANRVREPAAAVRSVPLPPLWFAVAAMLLFVALLLSFDHVVRQGVAAAEMRRQDAAAQSAARWRCQAMQQRQQRDACAALLQAATPADGDARL